MSGLDIWPGMVDAGSTIGLFEIGSLAETQDSCRRRPVPARAAQQHGASPRQRAHPGDAGQRHPDLVRRADRAASISGQGCLIDLNGWVPRELVIADPVGPERDDPDLHLPHARIAPARPGPGPARARARGAAGGEAEATRAAEGAARQDQGAVPQGARLRHGRRPRPASGAKLRPRPTSGSRRWSPTPAARSR